MKNCIPVEYIDAVPNISNISILMNSQIIYGKGNPTSVPSIPTIYFDMTIPAQPAQWTNMADGNGWIEVIA
jgi:hypothetical protein